jgi:FKBP-type peptidyl-prolyl cis-trans isomerase SlyD
MDKPQNRFLSVHYQLYTVAEGEEKQLEEQTSREHPFELVSGFGIALDSFERNLIDLPSGTPFDFTVSAEEGFGPYDPEGVHKLSRDVFSINGHFDHDNIFPGAVITLVDEEEHRFMARVTKVEDDSVTIDTNHPLAGKTLNFTGLLLDNHEATLEEIKNQLNQLGANESGCACGCGHHHEHMGECNPQHDNCGCGHHEHHNGEGGCGCGHCH